MDIKTVKIKSKETEAGYMIINESDFVEGEHELYGEGEGDKVPGKKAAKTDAKAPGEGEGDKA